MDFSVRPSATSPTAPEKRATSFLWIAVASISGRRCSRTYEPLLLHHLLLQEHQSLGERLGTGRAARNVNVDRNHLVDAVAHRVGELEQAAAIRAASHRQHVLRVGHLLV